MGKQSKRRLFIKKVCKYFFFQILVLLLLFDSLYATKQYIIEDLKQETIVVHDIEYVHMGSSKRNRRYMVLYTDDHAYKYNLFISDKSCGYSVEELNQKLKSAPLNILVQENFFSSDEILNAYNEQDIFYSLDEVNKSSQVRRKTLLGVFAVLELIFLAFSGFMIYLEYSTTFSRYKKKKKKKRKENQSSKTV